MSECLARDPHLASFSVDGTPPLGGLHCTAPTVIMYVQFADVEAQNFIEAADGLPSLDPKFSG